MSSTPQTSPSPPDNFEPIATEDSFELEVRGELPRALTGTLYRNGPNPQFPAAVHHWFHGDGMVHAFHIEERRVRYLNRYVRTPKFLAEQRAGGALRPGEGHDGGLANTNIVWHGGRLLALEENHAPIEIEPVTLKTGGYRDFGGHVTAHPKIDPLTGELVFFAYEANGSLSSTLAYGVADANGRVTRRESFAAPYCSMVHDFIVTAKHVVLPVLPLTGDRGRAARGEPAYAWEPSRGAFLGVMPRDRGAEAIRWLTLDPCYVYHVMNAWDEDDTIVADVMQSPSAPLFPDPDGAARPPVQARLVRWIIPTRGDASGIRQSALDDIAGEFPRLDDRRAGLSYRHGWFAGQPDGCGTLAFDRLVHIDHANGGRQVWQAGPKDNVSEPVFVPRHADAAEGDGWIVALAYRAAENVSELVVFEARDLARGPVATARLPRRVPNGFHGNWRAAS